MAKQYIKIRGANEHNLKHISLDIPRNELVVLTGLSGSGKSSLAFDTIYAEGQRRYICLLYTSTGYHVCCKCSQGCNLYYRGASAGGNGNLFLPLLPDFQDHCIF